MTREANTLTRIGAVISSSLKLEDTANLVLEQIKRIIPYDQAAIFLSRSGYIEVTGSNGFPEDENIIGQRIPFPQPGGLCALAMKYREPVICNNIPEEFPSYRQLYKKKDVVSWIGMPLAVRDNVFGILSLGSFTNDFYSIRHYEIVKKFQDNIAIAIDNAILYEQTHKQATHDQLTELHNRQGFREHVESLLSLSKRNGKSFALALLDIDHFKRINDNFGHDNGDRVLRKVSHIILENTRRMDIPARYGGEEFVVFFPETSEQEAVIIGERIRKNVENCKIEEIDSNVTVSLGMIITEAREEDTIEGIIKEADKLLYEAKKKGRNIMKSRNDTKKSKKNPSGP